MSMFKAVTAFKLKEEFIKHFDDVQDWLETSDCMPTGTQWYRMGIESIVNENDFQLITVAKGERILPRATITRAVAEKLKDIPKEEQTRKVKAEFVSEFVQEHLPKAPVKVTEVPCGVYNGWLFVGSSSAKLVDDVVSFLRGQIGLGLVRFEDSVEDFYPCITALARHELDGLIRYNDHQITMVGSEKRKVTISDPHGSINQDTIEDFMTGQGCKPTSLTCHMYDDGSTVASFKINDVGVITGLKTLFSHDADAEEKETASTIWGQVREVYFIYAELHDMALGAHKND